MTWPDAIATIAIALAAAAVLLGWIAFMYYMSRGP